MSLVFGAPRCWVVAGVIPALGFLLGELCGFVTLLFFILTPWGVLLLILFLWGDVPAFLLATLLVIISGPPDSLAWIGTSDWLDSGNGPRRSETCLLSSLRVLIGDRSYGDETGAPGGLDPEGWELFSTCWGSIISSRYWISISCRRLDPVEFTCCPILAFPLEGNESLSFAGGLSADPCPPVISSAILFVRDLLKSEVCGIVGGRNLSLVGRLSADSWPPDPSTSSLCGRLLLRSEEWRIISGSTGDCTVFDPDSWLWALLSLFMLSDLVPCLSLSLRRLGGSADCRSALRRLLLLSVLSSGFREKILSWLGASLPRQNSLVTRE